MSSEDHGLIEIDGPVVFFTGAGVSVGAGLPTYRGTGGLYTSSTDEPPHADDLTPERLPGLWEKFDPRLRAAGDLRPAAAHEAIAAFEAASEEPVTVVTQNVDGLHSAAGSTRVVELHGSLLWVRCIPNDHVQELADTTWNGDNVPACFTCGSPAVPVSSSSGRVSTGPCGTGPSRPSARPGRSCRSARRRWCTRPCC